MADLLTPGDIAERYEIVQRLGVGGMAEVYLARHTTLETQHALKVLTLTGPSLHERLADEGRIQARLKHPNIVAVTDRITVKGHPALVMEFVAGPTLRDWIRMARPSPEEAEAMFRGIVAGVAAAHEAGVIHRDLTPSNVLVATASDGTLVPKVADFGLVKVVRNDSPVRTRSGVPMGTPNYMAPEQIRDAANVDRRADVFSLGCILYELLAHVHAYRGNDLIEIFTAIDDQRRDVLPDRVPLRLNAVVERCLRKRADDRYATCEAILAALDSVVVPAPQPVREETTPSTHPLPLVGALVASLATVGLLAAGVTLVALQATGDGPLDPCPVTGDLLGYAETPWVFERKVGEVWQITEPTKVVSLDGDGVPGGAQCLVKPPAQILLSSPLITYGETKWVAVRGDKVMYGQPPVPVDPEAEVGVVGDRCLGEDGTLLGWFYTKPKLLDSAPKKGGTWQLTYGRSVVADYPRAENGNKTGEVVCALRSGAVIDIVDEPARVKPGRGHWVPVTAGGIRE